MLVDHQIKSLGLVSPLQEQLLQPASVDLTLGCNSARIKLIEEDPRSNGGVHNVIMPLQVGIDQPTYTYYKRWDTYTLWPGEFALFETAETITLPIDIAGKFEGKSSLGRIGLMTHVTAGFIDPGFSGVLTLELYNCGPLKLVLRPGIKIGQVSFTVLGAMPERAYGHPTLGSHYQGADTVQGGRFN
jgi:dCTP deaminase